MKTRSINFLTLAILLANSVLADPPTRKYTDDGAPPFKVLAPGEKEEHTRTEREANGIPVSDETWGAIVKAASGVGVGDNRVPPVTQA